MLLELRTLMLCLVQLSKWRECKAKDAEKLLSQWEKGAKFNFKIKAQVYERCFFSWMKCYLQCRRQISCVRASMHRINSLELLSTLMMCLVQLSKWRECKAKDAEKLLSQWEKVANELFCRASNVRASMHRITGLDLLRTLMLCLVQLSKWRESKATDAEKLLSERKLLNAILRVKLKYMKYVSFSWNEMLFAM